MESSVPPEFAKIADTEAKNAFLGGHPEVVLWLTSGTKLFKWTKSIRIRFFLTFGAGHELGHLMTKPCPTN
jgi:hypothetical protein